MNTLTKLKTAQCQVFVAKLTNFSQLDLTNDPQTSFQKSLNGLSERKGPENIRCAVHEKGPYAICRQQRP